MKTAEVISNYFHMQTKVYPAFNRPDRLRGWFDDSRARAFQFVTEESITIQRESPFTELTATIIQVRERQLSAVLAYYSDDALLWLDDHANDLDFEKFAEREQLANWLPARVDALASLLIGTKFNYLGWPHLVREVSDIQPLPERGRALKTPEELIEYDRKMADVAGRIHAPTFVGNISDIATIEFFVWTKIFEGRLLKFRCYFHANGRFTYDHELLADRIGMWFAPH
jgi:hypothetical protein